MNKIMTEESNGDTICTDCYEEKHYNSLEYKWGGVVKRCLRM